MQISISNAIGGGGGAQGSGGGSSFASTNSFTFDGNNDYVDMGNVLNFDRLDPFTMSAWVKSNTNASSGMILSKQETSVNFRGYMFYISSSNELKFSLRRQNQTYNRLQVTSTDLVTLGSWHNVVCTYDGSSTEAGFKFYIDGQDAGSNGSGSTLGGGSSLATTIPLQIGARNSQYNFFDGNIDEVAIFNSELSSSDITTIYNNGVPNDISSLSPLSWWRMGEEANHTKRHWTLTDQGSGGNNGFSDTLPLSALSTDVPS